MSNYKSMQDHNLTPLISSFENITITPEEKLSEHNFKCSSCSYSTCNMAIMLKHKCNQGNEPKSLAIDQDQQQAMITSFENISITSEEKLSEYNFKCSSCSYSTCSMTIMLKHKCNQENELISLKKMDQEQTKRCFQHDTYDTFITSSEATMKKCIYKKHTKKCKIRKLRCNTCNFSTYSKVTLLKHTSKRHSKRKHRFKSLICLFCRKLGKSTFNCNFCHFSSSSKTIMKKHALKKHNKEHSFQKFACFPERKKSQYFENDHLYFSPLSTTSCKILRHEYEGTKQEAFHPYRILN